MGKNLLKLTLFIVAPMISWKNHTSGFSLWLKHKEGFLFLTSFSRVSLPPVGWRLYAVSAVQKSPQSWLRFLPHSREAELLRALSHALLLLTGQALASGLSGRENEPRV